VKRLFLMTDGYGFYTPHFYPSATGRDYPSNGVIKSLDPLRDHVSILGNLKTLNGHGGMKYVATGNPQSANFGDSLDQYVSRHVSDRVPFDSLLISTQGRPVGGSFRDGVPVSMMYDTEEIFDYLFSKGDVGKLRKELGRKQSVLDLCLEEAKALSSKVSTLDKRRLDDFLNSIRETEKVVKKDVHFLDQPPIDPGIPKEGFAQRSTNQNDDEAHDLYMKSLMKFVEIAFKFDLTRVAYIWEHGRHHGTTHHGRRPGPVTALTKYNTATVDSIAEMLTTFKELKMPGGKSLLDETLFVWTAGLGSAAAHKGSNVPAIVAGGGLQHHGSYTQFSHEEKLTKLYLTAIQKMGIESGQFNDSAQTLDL
jgi:hypothetical protein